MGNGVEYFDVPGFGADFAYTVDGGSVGEIEYENFNAANLRVEVQDMASIQAAQRANEKCHPHGNGI